MKTHQASKKILYISSLLLGTVLLLTPALAVAGTTKYNNSSGENAILNVTDNYAGSIFTVGAAGSCGNATVASGCLTIPVESDYNPNQVAGYIFEVGGFIEGSSGLGNWTQFPGYGDPVPGYTFLGNSPLQTCSGYGVSQPNLCVNGYETLYSYLSNMHSVYMFTGTGKGDMINLNGGLTADTFSITSPGASTQVWINSGLGNSTYNIVLGNTGTLTIGAVHSTSAYNYYNIVYTS